MTPIKMKYQQNPADTSVDVIVYDFQYTQSENGEILSFALAWNTKTNCWVISPTYCFKPILTFND